MTTKPIILIALVLYASANPAFAQTASSGTAPTVRFTAQSPQLTMIETQPIVASPIPLADALGARVAYDEDRTVKVGVGFTGRIVALKVAAGDMVKAGQVLAEIDSPDFGSANADLRKARADEHLKKLVVERAQELGPGEAIAAKDLEAAQAEYASAQAEAQRAEQRLKNLNPRGLPVHGQMISLTTPVAGVVTQRTATLAQEVRPDLDAPLFVVTDPKKLWLLIDVPEKLLGSLKRGSPVHVQSDAYPDEAFKARVVQLGQVIDPNSRRAVVRAQLDNPTGRLLPEMFVRASIQQDSGMGLRVPNKALVQSGVHTYVYVQTAPGEFQRRRVAIARRGNEFSYVTEGLASGESVVAKGALLLDGEMSARKTEAHHGSTDGNSNGNSKGGPK